MKAAIYSIVTTIKQVNRANRIDHELAKLKGYCEKEKYSVIGTYYDIGTGVNFKRTGFSQFLLDVESGKIKVKRLICSSNDKYSRGFMEALLTFQKLQSKGIKIIYIEEGQNQ